jgi:hypothetical protein
MHTSAKHFCCSNRSAASSSLAQRRDTDTPNLIQRSQLPPLDVDVTRHCTQPTRMSLRHLEAEQHARHSRTLHPTTSQPPPTHALSFPSLAHVLSPTTSTKATRISTLFPLSHPTTTISPQHLHLCTERRDGRLVSPSPKHKRWPANSSVVIKSMRMRGRTQHRLRRPRRRNRTRTRTR